MQNKWYKKNDTDKTYWLDNGSEVKGEFIFSFDKKKTYNLFSDFPDKLTKEEVEIFVKENIYWADYFSERLEKWKSK